MPWSNEGGGGPWQPKNQGPKNQGPWGQGPGGNGGGNKGGGGQPPDLEELLRRSKDRFKNVLPPGGGTGLGGVGGKGIAALVMLAILGWLATGFYTVRTNEVALQLLFGRFVGKTTEGLNYNWPYPIGGVIKVPVTDVKNIEVGQSVQTGRGQQLATDSLMLTSDANIVDIAFSIQWRISPTAPEAYVFNIQTPDNTIKRWPRAPSARSWVAVICSACCRTRSPSRRRPRVRPWCPCRRRRCQPPRRRAHRPRSRTRCSAPSRRFWTSIAPAW